MAGVLSFYQVKKKLNINLIKVVSETIILIKPQKKMLILQCFATWDACPTAALRQEHQN